MSQYQTHSGMDKVWALQRFCLTQQYQFVILIYREKESQGSAIMAKLTKLYYNMTTSVTVTLHLTWFTQRRISLKSIFMFHGSYVAKTVELAKDRHLE